MPSIPPPCSEPARRHWLSQLNRAASDGDVAHAQALLDALTQDPTMGDPNGVCSEPPAPGSPLHIAVRSRQVAMVKLLARDPRVHREALDEFGNTPLVRAVSLGAAVAPEVVEALLLAGANPTARGWPSSGDTGQSLAQAAIMMSGVHAAEILDVLWRHRALGALNLDEVDATGNTLLHRALEYDLNPADLLAPRGAVVWLLAHGASLTQINHDGHNALDRAVLLHECAPPTLRLIEGAVLHATANEAHPTATPVDPASRRRL